MNRDHQAVMTSPAVMMIVFVLAFGVRGGIGFLAIERLSSDPDAYKAIASTLSASGVFGLTTPAGTVQPTAFRPPLYPWVLSVLPASEHAFRIAVLLVHALLGALTVALAFDLTRRLELMRTLTRSQSRWAVVRFLQNRHFPACLAAILVTMDPILVTQSTLVMTETLATFLATLVWWLWVGLLRTRSARLAWSHALLLAVNLSLAYLCRPTFLVWAGFIVLNSLWIVGRRSQNLNRIDLHRQRPVVPAFSVIASIIGMLGLSVCLWTSRNVRQLSHPVWATTHGGYTLLLANNPLFYDHLRQNWWRVGPLDRRWDATDFLDRYSRRYDADGRKEAFWYPSQTSSDTSNFASGLSDDKPSSVFLTGPSEFAQVHPEVADDIYVGQMASATIQRQPEMFLWSCLVRVLRLWSPLPHEGGPIRFLVGLYYTGLIATALVAVGRHHLIWRSEWLPAMTLVATLTVVHAVYWSNMRMRAPVTVPLVVAAIGFLPSSFTSRRRGDS